MPETAGPGEITLQRDGEKKTWVLSGEVRIDGLLDDGWEIIDEQ